jgi:hypothetical protein
MKKETLIGYISKSELNFWKKTPIEKANGTPITFDVWKDYENMRFCYSNSHLLKVKITIELI